MSNFIFVIIILFFTSVMGCSTHINEEIIQPLTEEFKVIKIYSKSTNTNYRIRLKLPKNYSDLIKYPVIYVIDGYYWFEYINDNFTELIAKNKLTDVILVGIGYEGLPFNDDGNNKEINQLRMVDLTYPRVMKDNKKQGGGALLFYDFIKTELIPNIEDKYSIDQNNRSIFGHSLGGYFAFFQMINFREDALFKNIIASSPSFWWSQPYIYELIDKAHQLDADLPFNLYLSAGIFEPEIKKGINKMESRLSEYNNPNLYYKSNIYYTSHYYTGVKAFADVLEIILK